MRERTNEAAAPASDSALRAEVGASGTLHRLIRGRICVNLFVGNELDGGPANLYLRSLDEPSRWTALLGPRSPTRFERAPKGHALLGRGIWNEIEYAVALRIARHADAWFWHVTMKNTGRVPRHFDLIHTQDVALAPYDAIRLNEYYVSQYVDHTPLTHSSRGHLIASRQNLAVAGQHPWCLIGSLRRARSFATDAWQFYGLAARAGEEPPGLTLDLPGRRLQHEHSMIALQDEAMRLAPGTTASAGYFGVFETDHPDASAPGDLSRVETCCALPEGAPLALEQASHDGSPPAMSLFSHARRLEALDLDDGALRETFGENWRHEERDAGDALLSFFHGENRHVVMRAKELRVLRPHGHLLRTGTHLTPDESALTSTPWMAGVFHSMLTQGHVSFNRFLSTARSYLGLFRSQGQRVFVEIEGRWSLLDVPSAFEMAPDECRWLYRHARGTIEARATATRDAQLTLDLEVKAGAAVRFLVCHHLALDGDDGSTSEPICWHQEREAVVIEPPQGSPLAQRFACGTFRIEPRADTALEKTGGDELLFLDGRSRSLPYICMVLAPARSAGLRILGRLIEDPERSGRHHAPRESLTSALEIRAPETSPLLQPAARLAEIVPWFAHDALVHYLSPRGLEQYSGGGWGTRDVCQGPVELLLALGHFEPLRDLLLRVMRAQNADGDWPQWFMFFGRERAVRAGDSHGDIVYWPLLALAQYLIASRDHGLLDERVPFFDASGTAEEAPVWQHVQRALAVTQQRIIRGTALAAYGHGDWNDALQPADPAMRERLCSTWTVTLHHQMLRTLARGLRAVGRDRDADALEQQATRVRGDFKRLLLVDDVLAGYVLFEDQGAPQYLLHPRDTLTGVRYSALAMIHAILEDLLTPEQARAHLAIMREHLSGPDGLRLFDRPMCYHGGPQRLFQRAESAAFFGREIGLMYMHAHLRYAQALAHLGDTEGFFRALCQANPIGIREIVPSATLRQANCYYSSSDALFRDRYEAQAEYHRIAAGSIALEGGWRVYSSGPGIAVALIIRHLLGLRREADALVIDPVIPAALDGLRARIELLDRDIEVHYRIARHGCGVEQVSLNGAPLPCLQESNPYRAGGVRVPVGSVLENLRGARDRLEVRLR